MDDIETLSLLGNVSRLRIVALLVDSELCVCELEEITGIRQVNISKHLHRLRQAGVVSSRREKQRVFYYLTETFLSREALLSHIVNLVSEIPQLRTDRERFLAHEQDKDEQVYVCNVFKKENLS